MSLRTFNVKRYRSVKLETFAEKLLHERNQPGLTAHLHVRNKLTACWQTVLRDINVNTVTMETAQKHIFKHDVFGFSRDFLLSPLQARQTTPTQPVRIVSKSTLKNSHKLVCLCLFWFLCCALFHELHLAVVSLVIKAPSFLSSSVWQCRTGLSSSTE